MKPFGQTGTRQKHEYLQKNQGVAVQERDNEEKGKGGH